MKSFLCSLLLVLVAALPAVGEDASAEDRARALAYLEKTKTAFLASVAGLSDAQLAFKPGPTRWSVAETAEHIASSEDFLFNLIQEKVMSAPARTEQVNVKEIDDFILQAIPDRSKKATAPEPLMPTKRFGGIQGSTEHFKASRAKTIAFLKENKALRGHAIDSPLGKKLDPLQWVLFIAAHSERHTKQIEEVKADAGFPKK